MTGSDFLLIPPDVPFGFVAAAVQGARPSCTVVGRGVSQFARDEGPACVELDTLLPDDHAAEAQAFIDAFDAWLAAITEGLAVSSQELGASAMSRFAIAWLQAWQVAQALKRFAPNAAFEIFRAKRQPPWRGERLVSARKVDQRSQQRAREWARTKLALSTLALLPTLSVRAEMERQRAKDFDNLNHEPQAWLVVPGEVEGPANKLISAMRTSVVDQPLEQCGVIYAGALGAKRPPLPLDKMPFVQTAIASPALHPARVSLALLRRIMRHPFKFGGIHLFEQEQHTQAVARWIASDVSRIIHARAAVEALASRVSLENRRVFFPHASLAAYAATDLALQRAGARTIEWYHGSLADPIDLATHARTLSSERWFWTKREPALYRRHLGAQPSRGGVLTISPPQHQAARSQHQLLVLSNYAHPILGFDGPAPREFALHQLLAELAVLREQAGHLIADITFRPHPHDNPHVINRVLAATPWIRRSKATLAEDLEQHSVIVATVSSTIVEAAASSSAEIFLHDIPFHDRAGVMSLVPQARCFKTGKELSTLLMGWHHSLPQGEANLSWRRSFFGDP